MAFIHCVMTLSHHDKTHGDRVTSTGKQGEPTVTGCALSQEHAHVHEQAA